MNATDRARERVSRLEGRIDDLADAECPACGALIVDQDKHAGWHADINRRIRVASHRELRGEIE